ncbi:MAG TPA: RNA polymerase subunit sigma-70 [Candidatus Limnocylindrales bacterium]|nr:RNA polymerase subunit sigma-70 [Candidatus Limnocylindrales bacterium]
MTSLTSGADFEAAVERHRREIHVHSYRMLGSFTEAEDAVQETFLRAWQGRASFDGSSAFRAWLYRIATNVCLDAIRRSNRRPRSRSLESIGDVPWLEPYPDRLLDELSPPEADPHAVAAARETIELAFLAAVQLLPPRQRAVLLMRDVLEFSAGETAAHLDMTSAAVNSALQRARATLRAHRPHGRQGPPPQAPTPAEMELVRRFIDAHERADVEAAAEMLREDARVAMPPHPFWFHGREAILESLVAGLKDPGEWRLVPARANRMPAAASYLRTRGDSPFRAFKLDVIRFEDGLVAEITTFDAALFSAFGLSPVLAEGGETGIGPAGTAGGPGSA